MKKERGEVKRVGDLFEKYRKTLIAPERTIINAFVEVVEDVLGINIDAKRIKYTPGTKTISLSSLQAPVKSEINLRKDELLNHLKGRLGEKSAPRAII